jgi:hypothetical protein
VSGRDQLYVIDTSSILAVRETFGKSKERKVFAGLTVLVTDGRLFFPSEVCGEVERGVQKIPDTPTGWISSCRKQAEKKADLQMVREVLEVAPEVLDSDSPHEPADPYVVALALGLRGGFLAGLEVTIVTEDRKDKPRKVSLATAAGMLGLPTVPLLALCRMEDLLP